MVLGSRLGWAVAIIVCALGAQHMPSAGAMPADQIGVPSSLVPARTVGSEPPMGALKPGQRVLVDDGSCPAGQIKEVIGGNHRKVGGTGLVERRRRCVRRR